MKTKLKPHLHESLNFMWIQILTLDLSEGGGQLTHMLPPPPPWIGRWAYHLSSVGSMQSGANTSMKKKRSFKTESSAESGAVIDISHYACPGAAPLPPLAAASDNCSVLVPGGRYSDRPVSREPAVCHFISWTGHIVG